MVFAFWAIDQVNLPSEILKTIKSFLILDKRTKAYAEWILFKNKPRKDTLDKLRNQGNRKAPCWIVFLEEDQDQESEWVFYIPKNVIMHSANCPRCGDYIWSRSYLDEKIMCYCI